MNHQRIPLACCTILLACAQAAAQSDDMLTARTIKNTLLLQIDETAKTFRATGNRKDTDRMPWEFAIKDQEPYILVANNAYNLHLRMVNPLRYKVVVEGGNYEEDPYEKTLNTLADNVQSLLGIVSRGSITNGSINSGDAFRNAVMSDAGKPLIITKSSVNLTTPDLSGRPAMTMGKAEAEGVSDYGIRRAIMLLRQVGNSEEGKSPELDALVHVVVKSVHDIEDNAGTDMIAQATRVIQRLVTVDLSATSASTVIKELDDVIKAMTQRNQELGIMVSALSKLGPAIANETTERRRVLEEQLEKQNKESEKQLESLRKDATFNQEVEKLMKEQNLSKPTAEYEVAWAWGWAPPEFWPYFQGQAIQSKQFVELALEEFADRMAQFADQRQVLIANLQELMNLVTAAQDRASTTEHGTELLYQQTIPKGKVEAVTLKVQQRSFKVLGNYSVTVDESDLFSQKFKFLRAHTFYPQIFPSLVFVNSSYEVFSAEEDSTGVMRVASETSTSGYVNVAGMVNFNLKLGQRDEVPFLQLGVSAKRSRPQFFLGAGVRFTDWFAISGGAVMDWTASLDKLAVGDRVGSQDLLEKDLKYNLGVPRLYFGIQLRPSALTKKP
jgi:translation initiation factor 2B subunit (eIF-2B alpha/beta/delta family)